MNNRIASGKLIAACHIMSSDDDQPLVSGLVVGFDEQSNLVVLMDNVDYDDSRYDCCVAAVVNPQEAFRLSRRLGVQLHKLPEFIGSCMSEWNAVVNPTCRQVQDCFDEIYECLLDEGCRFRIVRAYRRDGSACC